MTPEEQRIADALHAAVDAPEMQTWAHDAAQRYRDDYWRESSDDRTIGFIVMLDALVVVAAMIRLVQVFT